MSSVENNPLSRCRRGQMVEVRGLDEILRTLDADGKLDGIPFMPEMARYCGCRFKVYRHANKTCVEGYGVRLLGDAVFLEGLRCDGAMHDGCQRNCLFFWKKAWLKPVAEAPAEKDERVAADAAEKLQRLPTREGDRYFCQSTELAAATRPLSRWDMRHFAQDLWLGEITLPRLAHSIFLLVANKLRRLLGGRMIGQLAGSRVKPAKGDLDLRAGQWVEVKPREEIEETLNAEGRNRGLSFEAEMLLYCGRRHQVAYPVRKIIDEQTGKMTALTNTVVLDGVLCQGICSKNCPRANPLYWREIWLKRV